MLSHFNDNLSYCNVNFATLTCSIAVFGCWSQSPLCYPCIRMGNLHHNLQHSRANLAWLNYYQFDRIPI